MKKIFDWQFMLAGMLICLSVFFYFVHYYVFHDLHHILLYLIGDIAFLFLDVLIVMLLLHRLLEFREKKLILKKLNMVIGTFFCEVGTELLRKMAHFDPALSSMAKELVVTKDWTDKEFARVRKSVRAHAVQTNSRNGDLAELKGFLVGKRTFLLQLLDNPNLLEHESFTDVLWAVFHLTDDLAHRADLSGLPDTDYQHLSGDIKRAYQQLIVQWLDYMKYLKRDYPYLFSLAMRTNPFDAQASVVVR